MLYKTPETGTYSRYKDMTNKLFLYYQTQRYEYVVMKTFITLSLWVNIPKSDEL